MKAKNLIKIIALLLGLLSIVFLIRIISAGDEEIKMAALNNQFGLVSPLVLLGIIALLATAVITISFSLVSLFSQGGKVKRTLLFIGCFALVIVIAYGLSDGVETTLNNGDVLTKVGSRWIGAGLRVFYILIATALAAMLALPTIVKLIKR